MKHGVLLLLVAMGLTPGVDGLAKVLAGATAPFTVAFLRFLSAGLIALMAARLIGTPINLRKELTRAQLCRTALLAGATCCLVLALNLVPLAIAVGGFLIAPIISTLLGAAFLGEKLGPNRIAGAALAFTGALIVCQPMAKFEIGMVLALIGGTLLGIYLVATRASAASASHPLATLAVQCLVGAALIAPFAATEGLPEVDSGTLAIIISLGALAATTHVLTVAAYERADTGVLAPFMYFNLISAIIVGYVVFDEMPSHVTLLGLSAIGIGGVITVLDSRFIARCFANRIAFFARAPQFTPR